jgi:hypoxanthine phosphoribosyltransferase
MTINGKEFHVFIHRQDIHDQIVRMAGQVSRDYKDTTPLFLVILNGAFVFAADFIREVSISSEITFIRLASYKEMKSTGQVERLLGLADDIAERHVVILEDIVDTGQTLDYILKDFDNHGVASVEIATLLFKDLSVKRDFAPKYVGFHIPDHFVVGYGLDYDGFGRNLKDIYQIT